MLKACRTIMKIYCIFEVCYNFCLGIHREQIRVYAETNRLRYPGGGHDYGAPARQHKASYEAH